MDYAELVTGRRMTRRFRADLPVPVERLEELLRLAGHAPSAGFSQGWDYVIARTPAETGRFWAAATPAGAGAGDAWLRGVRAAPALILAYADEQAYRDRYAEADKAQTGRSSDWPVPYWLTDTAMGVMIVLLGARDLALDALFFGVPGERHEAVRAAFALPPGRQLVGVIALGTEERRVGGSPRRRRRRGPAEFIHWGAFGVPRAEASAEPVENAEQTGPAGPVPEPSGGP